MALRINPNIDAHTHHYITTGLEENKFGLDISVVPQMIQSACGRRRCHLSDCISISDPQIATLGAYRMLVNASMPYRKIWSDGV